MAKAATVQCRVNTELATRTERAAKFRGKSVSSFIETACENYIKNLDPEELIDSLKQVHTRELQQLEELFGHAEDPEPTA